MPSESTNCSANENLLNKSQKRLVSFNSDYIQEFKWAKKSKVDKHAECVVCNATINIASRGRSALEDHSKTAKHEKALNASKCQSIATHFKETTNDWNKVTRAELLFTAHIIEHDLPIASSTCTSSLFKKMFPDSKIAEQYHCGKTKTFCLINAMSSISIKELVIKMRNAAFSIATDGSNDQDLQKMNPLTIRIFDTEKLKVTTNFLDMCLSKSSRADDIFCCIKNVFDCYDIPWNNCVSLSVDNAAVNTGCRNSILTKCKQLNENIHCLPCPCHVVHNASRKAHNAMRNIITFDAEDMMADLYYWFKYSQKRKATLQDFCELSDITYKKVLKFITVRWLSLSICIDRTLKLFNGLKLYFMSEKDTSARCTRLKLAFSDEMTQVYLLFLQATLPVFSNFIETLEKEEPCIHFLYDSMSSLCRKLLQRFMPDTVMSALKYVTDCNFERTNQSENSKLYIGFICQQQLTKSALSQAQTCTFYDGVRTFFETAVSYLFQKLPFKDEVVQNAAFIDIKQKDILFSQIVYFATRFNNFLNFNTKEFDELFDEFNDFIAWKVTNDTAKESIDKIWSEIGTLTISCGKLRFPLLFKIAKMVLVIPHSNANEERIFSIVRRNKTDFRGSLDLKGTLSSVISWKLNLLAGSQCYDLQTDQQMLNKCKTATKDYNMEHVTK